MGKTVAQLDAELSLSEYYEWQAYYNVEPFGSPADDDRWRQQYALFFSANTSAGTEQPDWLNRVPEETARLRAKMESSVEDKVDAFFARHNAIASEPNPEDLEYVIEDGVIVAVPLQDSGAPPQSG